MDNDYKLLFFMIQMYIYIYLKLFYPGIKLRRKTHKKHTISIITLLVYLDIWVEC